MQDRLGKNERNEKIESERTHVVSLRFVFFLWIELVMFNSHLGSDINIYTKQNVRSAQPFHLVMTIAHLTQVI